MGIFDFLQDHVSNIYGFAVSRTGSSDEAEDLGKDILLAVMRSLKQNPGVADRERYLWKIAHNVYVDHVRRGQREKQNDKNRKAARGFPVFLFCRIKKLIPSHPRRQCPPRYTFGPRYRQ